MPVTVSVRLSVKGRRPASLPGRLASLVTSRCTLLGYSSFGQLPKFEAGHVNGTCRIVYRQQLKTCWPAQYYLANLAAGMDLRSLAATIKARWICEQAHQQLKEELGLDHFEGRSWQGLHRHALMTMIAYAFLQYRRLKTARREKKNRRPTAAANVAGGSPRHRRPHHAIKSSAMSVLPILDQRGKAA